MKKLIPVILGLILMANLHAQMFSVSVAPTYVNVFPKTYYGGRLIKPHYGIGISAEYLKSIGDRFSIGLGIDYLHSSLEVPPPPFNVETQDFHMETIRLLATSFKTVLNLNYGFFLTANPLIDIQLPNGDDVVVSNQTGLGLSISCGKRFEISQRIGIYLEPVFWIKNLISLGDPAYPKRLNALGVKAGISIK